MPGLIPAHAGKTRTLSLMVFISWAHPRSRGENTNPPMTRRPASGSSPLTRGKLREVQEWREDQGLIPAHAGKTHWLPGPRNLTKAHPRSRGENVAGRDDDVAAGGSSPLTRGKPRRTSGCRPPGRLIPAHAGKTPQTTPSRPSPPAHPRSRGENQAFDPTADGDDGSSPLTRGKRSVSATPTVVVGLIPAHAGKTKCTQHVEPPSQAHPRSRGENAWCTTGGQPAIGSSPLTRGKLGDLLTLHTEGRLIPAHAGKTQLPGAPTPHSWAHPRSRGENTTDVKNIRIETGSSPLTRGKRAFHTLIVTP